MKHVLLIAALPLAACAQEAPPAPQADRGDTLAPAPVITVEDRSPAQTASPNAAWQSPAFEGQTRAPRPGVTHPWRVEMVAEGLSRPWAFEFLPDGDILVTEQGGTLRVIGQDGTLSEPIAGVPEVYARNQGGLLDVALSPDFAGDRVIYLSYVEPREGGDAGTSVARARLSADESALEGLEVIFRQTPAGGASRHFGSRLVPAPDGAVFITLGDRGNMSEESQDPGNFIGAIARINPDGSIPADNPFADGSGGAPALWSYGHRNVQGADLHPDTGALWSLEHGPRGGDEINVPAPGANHGWPEVSYGENYSGTRINEGITAREGVVQPVYYWDPVIAPGALMFYDGALFPEWRGDVFASGLASSRISRLTLEGERVTGEEWLEVGARARDLRQGPDGALYFLANSEGALRRIVPDTGG